MSEMLLLTKDQSFQVATLCYKAVFPQYAIVLCFVASNWRSPIKIAHLKAVLNLYLHQNPT
jgi:hypothetical protein